MEFELGSLISTSKAIVGVATTSTTTVATIFAYFVVWCIVFEEEATFVPTSLFNMNKGPDEYLVLSAFFTSLDISSHCSEFYYASNVNDAGDAYSVVYFAHPIPD